MQNLFIMKVQIDWKKISRESYLREIPALRRMKQLSFLSPITFLAGENGTGKSTLLEAIAVAYGFNPEGGTRNYRFSTCDSHSQLYEAITLSRSFRKPRGGIFSAGRKLL